MSLVGMPRNTRCELFEAAVVALYWVDVANGRAGSKTRALGSTGKCAIVLLRVHATLY